MWPSQSLAQGQCVLAAVGPGRHSPPAKSTRSGESWSGIHRGTPGGARMLGSCPGVRWLGILHPTPLPRATPSGYPPPPRHLPLSRVVLYHPSTQAPPHPRCSSTTRQSSTVWRSTLKQRHYRLWVCLCQICIPSPEESACQVRRAHKDVLNESMALLEHQEEVLTASLSQHQGATPKHPHQHLGFGISSW